MIRRPRTTELRLQRRVRPGDPLVLERSRHAPELGPRILFFSGGTALRDVSRKIVEYSHNTIHIITPFDSGGSSASLREAFGMLAVGDLRNRLMALADPSLTGQPEIVRLFAYRFPGDADPDELRIRLEAMVDGRDPLVSAVADPMRKIIRNHLRFFAGEMPDGFDLRGANIGNLILVGGFLNQSRRIDPVIYIFSKLVEARGIVRPVASSDLHLAAQLEDGTTLVGQHLLTGKEVGPIRSRVSRVFLTTGGDGREEVRLEIRRKVRDLIASADLICYPMGSFYSSLVANLLPAGVGRAVRHTDVPKVYIPSTGKDPETLGMTLAGQVQVLIEYLQADLPRPVDATDLVSHVLVDLEARHVRKDELERIEALGPQVVNVPLITGSSDPYCDATLVSETLISLA